MKTLLVGLLLSVNVHAQPWMGGADGGEEAKPAGGWFGGNLDGTSDTSTKKDPYAGFKGNGKDPYAGFKGNGKDPYAAFHGDKDPYAGIYARDAKEQEEKRAEEKSKAPVREAQASPAPVRPLRAEPVELYKGPNPHMPISPAPAVGLAKSETPALPQPAGPADDPQNLFRLSNEASGPVRFPVAKPGVLGVVEGMEKIETFAPTYGNDRNKTDLDSMTLNELKAKMVDVQVEKHANDGVDSEKAAAARRVLYDVKDRIEKFDQKKANSYLALSREVAILDGRRDLMREQALESRDKKVAAVYVKRSKQLDAAANEISPKREELAKVNVDIEQMDKDQLLARMIRLQSEKQYSEEGAKNPEKFDEELKRLDRRLVDLVRPKAPPVVEKVPAKTVKELGEEIVQSGTALFDLDNGWNDQKKSASNSKIKEGCRITVSPVHSLKELDALGSGNSPGKWKIDTHVRVPGVVSMKSSAGITARIEASTENDFAILNCMDTYGFDTHVKGDPAAQTAGSMFRGSTRR